VAPKTLDGWNYPIVIQVREEESGRLDQAVSLARAEPLDGAILDVRLDGNTSYSLARELLDAGVAVVFLTGYEAESIEEEFRDIPRIAKPYDATRDQRVLMRAFSTH